MTDRLTIDQITSDQLDQLYDERDRLREDLTEAQNTSARRKCLLNRRRPELEHAEAVLARIAALADEYPAGIDTALIHEALATAEPADDDGPTVREVAADDRNWDVEKAGE